MKISQGLVTEADRNAALNIIYHAKLVNPMIMTLDEDKLSRSAAQNRLMWGWITDCEFTQVNQYAGMTKQDWHCIFKADYLMPIFVRDDSNYAELIAEIVNVVVASTVKSYSGLCSEYLPP